MIVLFGSTYSAASIVLYSLYFTEIGFRCVTANRGRSEGVQNLFLLGIFDFDFLLGSKFF